MDETLRKQVIDKNIQILYITCMAYISIGLIDFGSNMQGFLNLTMGESFVILIAGYRYIASAGCLLLLPIFEKFRHKTVVIFFEIINVLVYIFLALSLFGGKASGIFILCLVLASITVEKILTIVWPEFYMKLVPMERRQTFFGVNELLSTLFSAVGIYLSSYILLNQEILKGYAYLFIVTAGINIFFIMWYFRINDKFISIKKQKKHPFKFRKLIDDLKDKNFKQFLASKIFALVGFALTSIYAVIAIKKGYKEYDIALMGTIYMIAYATSNIIWGKIHTMYTDIIILSRAIMILGYAIVFIFPNMYLAFAISGIAAAGTTIGDIDLIGLIGKGKEIEYISILSVLDTAAAVGLLVISWIMYTLGITAALMISIVAIAISIFMLKRMEDVEKKYRIKERMEL